MSQEVELDDVFAMLDDCLPGHKRTLGDHYWRIEFNHRIFPTLPKGSHRGRKRSEIGHVRQMVRMFGIKDCASRHLPV